MIKKLQLIENGLLISVFTLMVGLAILQIVLRNGFGEGLLWIDSANKILLLWVAMLGGMIATRHQEHITIDILSHLVSEKHIQIINRIVSLITACVCGLTAYHSLLFVYSEYQTHQMAFLFVPNWLCQSIIPIGLIVITCRFVLNAIYPSSSKKELTL